MFMRDGQLYSPDQSFSAELLVQVEDPETGETDVARQTFNFPAGWLRTASPQEREGLGFTDAPAAAPRADEDLFFDGDPGAPRTVEQVRERLKGEVTRRRRQVEEGGMKLAGMVIATDAASQAKLTGAAVAAMLDPGYTVKWKTDSGAFVDLNHDTLLNLARAVRGHVQAAFDREAALHAQLDAATTPASCVLIDLEAGW